MANSGLTGPHTLSKTTVDAVVTKKSPGAYALGHTRTTDQAYIIQYVGRSDEDLNARIKQWDGVYAQFKYGYFPSPKAAFDKECQLFHDFTPPDNKVHPARPQGSNWKCPVSGCTALN